MVMPLAHRPDQFTTGQKNGSATKAKAIRDDSASLMRRMRRVRTPFQSYVIPKILMIARERMFASFGVGNP
jgi:hypothetical protein